MNLKEYRKNTHQTHMCDLVLLGKEGLAELNDKIDKFIRRFDSEEKELNLTQKVDGAPALFCWSKYPGYPDNSIALKGFTSGPQNALSSNEQIDAKYGDRPDMATKLKLGLQLAKYIPAGECWQGDCLFSKGDLKEESINGTDYLTFMPNKIVYAFSEDNADYNKVKNADFGIAFHTIYKDKDGEMRQGFNVDPTKLNAPDNFYIMSPAINASKDKADYDLSALENEYNNLKQLEQKLINDPAYEELINNSTFMNYWNTFENANLADKKQVNLNVNTFIGDLKEYVNDKLSKEYNKKLNTVKTDKGKQSATDKYNKDTQELANLIDTHKDTLTNLVNCLNSAANIKMLMWAGLKKAKNDYSTFYKSRTKGYIPSEGEGIAMSDMDGNIVKIVDRSTFSSYNRDPDIMSGFEHESLQEAKHRKLVSEISKEDARRIIDAYQDETSEKVPTRFLGLKYYLIEDDEFTYDSPKYDEYMPTSYELHGLDIRGKRVINLYLYRKFTPVSFGIAEELYWKKLNMFWINNKLKDADLSNIDLGDLDEDFKLNNNLQKALGDKAAKFIDFIKKLNMEHKAYDQDIHPLGLYVETRDKGTHQENVHNFWLKNFGLDTAKRGVGSAIASALIDMNYELRDSDEYKATLDDNDTNKLPADEKFKINLFYEWDAIKKDPFGDYSDDDPRKEMSFREFLQDKLDNGDYEDDREKQLIKDAIEEVKGGSGYFKEMMATQMADMGTFAKKPVKFSSKKKLKLEEDGNGKTAVIAFGRFNPPTIGHKKLIDTMVSVSKGEKPKLYLSHSVDSKKNPLSYDSKIRWATKAFSDEVDVIKGNYTNMFDIMSDLYKDGYTDIIYVGGEDRVGDDSKLISWVNQYNGKPDKEGNILYDFNSINFVNSGKRSGDDLVSNASASLARKYVLENDFDHFKQIVPFSESDAKKLFKELKYAMSGKEELFLEACNKRISRLNEAGEKINTPAGNILKPIIKNKLNDVEFKSLNLTRHPEELLRISSKLAKNDLISKLKSIFRSIPKDTIKFNGKDYQITDFNFNDISVHPGASREYDSIPVKIEATDGSDAITLYISISTSDDKFSNAKQYTPNKVLANGIGQFIKYSAAKFNEGYDFLENIYRQAVSTAKGDLNGFEAYAKDMTGVNELNVNSIMNDFGEVLSAGCLAKIMGKPNEMYFPAASNEKLIDFIVNGTIKVSQKAGSGATPSGDSIFDIVSSSDINIDQVLHDYRKTDIKRIESMIKFFKDNVFDKNVSIHDGYVNIFNKLVASNNNFVKIPDVSKLSKYFKSYSVSKTNIDKFINDVKNYIGSAIKFDEKRINSKEYCETLRIRYLARIAILAINSDPILIKGLNTLLSACLGEFIQVYLVNQKEFMNGHLIFKVKQVDSHYNYVFVDTSAISPNDKIGNKKLGMKLK